MIAAGFEPVGAVSPSTKTQEALVKALYECIGARPTAAPTRGAAR